MSADYNSFVLCQSSAIWQVRGGSFA